MIVGNESVRGWLNVLLMTNSVSLNQIKEVKLSIKKDYKDTVKTTQIMSYFKGCDSLEISNLSGN